MDDYMKKVEAFMLMQYPHMAEICLVIYALAGASRVKKLDESSKGPPMFWAQSLVLCFMMTFGGGILAPILLGRPIVLLVNDLIVPAVCLAWFVQFRMTNLWTGLMSIPLAPYALAVVTEIFRAKGICTMCDVAFETIKSSKYYPIPFFGPILLATIMGCGGLFLPLDKGLSALKTGAAWPLQSAFYVATFCHLTTHDPNIKPYLPFALLDKTTVHILCACFLCATSVMITAFGPWFNPFSPIHNLLYAVTGVPKPGASSSTSSTSSTAAAAPPAKSSSTSSPTTTASGAKKENGQVAAKKDSAAKKAD